ncbi:hypothetical protein BN6_38550 [Saccharothrix espanaensis DSM 44229]|uniref:Beta-lactamase-related domain-containing protein n=2 Tax=Saccharothrix espanaensis TaxID=103731 RepID=K0JYF0_SACES|nr:hypothetical protein BN6_38550 [Saccharothrix espanaensis DSM 44229]
MVIERVTGRSWRDEVTRRVLRPLGLRDTGTPVDRPHLPGPHASAYEELDGSPFDVTRFNPSVGGAAGSMTSTTADLERFARKLFTGGLLKPAERAELTRTTAVSTYYGLGAVVLPLSCGTTVLGHDGYLLGWLTEMWVDQDGSRSLTLSANMARGGLLSVGPLLDEVFC